jgi:hypothetical protein
VNPIPENPYEAPKVAGRPGSGRRFVPRWLGYSILALVAIWLLWLVVEGMAIHPRFRRVDPNWPTWIPDPRSFR